MLGEPPHGLGSHLLQETYLGQLRTMQAWVVLLFWTLLRATGGFSSYGYIQTEEYKTKYLKDLATVEDGNEKQLVSYSIPPKQNQLSILLKSDFFFQISDLHQVLERLQSIQFPALRKKHGYLPVVSIRDLKILKENRICF